MALRKKQLSFIIPLLFFIVLVALFYSRLGKDTQVVTNTALNRALPTVNLPLLGQPNVHVTNKELPKTPFILNVWGSWCVTCHAEHPFLLKMAANGIPIVGVNYKDDINDALNYLNENKDPFVMNLQDSAGNYGIELGLTGAPESFLVDSQGIIRQHIIGEINEERYNQRVLPCLTLLKSHETDVAKIQGACQ